MRGSTQVSMTANTVTVERNKKKSETHLGRFVRAGGDEVCPVSGELKISDLAVELVCLDIF